MSRKKEHIVAWGKALSVSLFCGLPLLAFSPPGTGEEEIPLMDEAQYMAEYPVVLSVTRLPQTPAQAPMAVSVIDRRMIDASGACELFELFRLVPGMLVGIKDGGTQAVSARSLSDEYSRRMQVLIDGRSVYTPAWAGVYWADLPITLDDIERIEVVRGPDAASYGANAFFGVINIVTREAVLDQGSSVRVTVGDSGVREAALRHGGQWHQLDYRLTVAFSEDDGLMQRYDSKRTRLLNFRGDYQLGLQDEISFLVGISDGQREAETPASELLLPREKGRSSSFEQISWQRSFDIDNVLSIRFTRSEHRNDETALIELDDRFERPYVALDYDMQSSRRDLELEHRFSPLESLRVVWGLGYRQDRVEAPGLFDREGVITNPTRFLFTSVEWQVLPQWTLNAGFLMEDNGLVEADTSPRLGVSYRVRPHHSIRVVMARADRVPTLIEDAINQWTRAPTVIPGVVVAAHSLAGNPALRSEHIVSTEIGYNGSFYQRSLVVDARLFREELSDLISLVREASPADNWDGKVDRFQNLDDATARGVEAEVSLHASAVTWVKLAYAYTDIDSSDRGVKIRYEGSAPRHNLSIIAATELGRATQASAAFSFYDNKMKGWEKNEYRDPVRRLDLRLARRLEYDAYDVELTLALRNVLGRYEAIQLLRPKEGGSLINEVGTSAYLSARVMLR